MSMKRRVIQLKEHSLENSAIWCPSAETLSRTDGSLDQIIYDHPVTKDGFLDTGIAADSSKSNVFVLGDSFVESSYSLASRRFIAQTDRQIQANVFNGGYSGMTSLHMLNVLVNKIGNLADPGDMVLLFVPTSDANAVESEGYWTDHPRYTPIQPPYNADPPHWNYSTRALLSTMIHFSNQVGLNVALATSPRREELDFNTESWLRKSYGRNRDLFQKMYDLRSDVINCTRAEAASKRVPLLDMHKCLGGKAEYFYDEVHLNPHGQNAAANYLTSFLKVHLHEEL